jgi:alcohol dehydrogenase class IV
MISLFRTTPRVVLGPGAIQGVGAEVQALGGSRVLIVTDPGVVEAGLLTPVQDSLEAAGVEFFYYSDVKPDPRYQTVEDCLAAARDLRPDCVIGLGGGSPIDVAKSAAMMLGNPGSVADYFGVDLVPGPGVPGLMIPTTAGTGGEVTPIVILSDEDEKLKRTAVSGHLFPRTAVLDPVLTLGLPPAVTATTGMDALVHAIEAYTSVNATGLTDMFAARAMELIGDHLRTAVTQGGNLDARSAMLEASLLAGIAFANAGLTAVHAFAFPIGAEFHIPHGVANTLMLAPVMRFNLVGNVTKFAEIAALMGEITDHLSDRAAAERSVAAVMDLAEDIDVPKTLGRFGVKEEHLPGLAAGVMKLTRLLANNPRVLTVQDAERIYREVL